MKQTANLHTRLDTLTYQQQITKWNDSDVHGVLHQVASETVPLQGRMK